MTIVTHALATTLGVRLLKLTGSGVVLAYVFGVGVDLDHVIKAPFYLKAIGLKMKEAITGGPPRRSPAPWCGSSPCASSRGRWVRRSFSSFTSRWANASAYGRCPGIPTR